MVSLADGERGADDSGAPGAESLVDGIVETLGREIIEGRLPPGADLNSVGLARRFGTSRTPVREAMLRLEREGLVLLGLNRRPRVTPLSQREIDEIYAIRSKLQALVAELLAPRITDWQLERLWECWATMEDAAARQDIDAYFWRMVDLRDAEAGFAGNQELEQALRALGRRTLRLRRQSLDASGRVTRSLSDHRRLLLAYGDRDTKLAAAIAESVVTQGLVALRVVAQRQAMVFAAPLDEDSSADDGDLNGAGEL